MFSSYHVWMWELDYKESWARKNWFFLTVVLEKTLESPLEARRPQEVHCKGNQSWIFIGRTDAEAPILWPPDAMSRFIGKGPNAGKDWKQEEKGMIEDKMVGWHQRLNGLKFTQIWVNLGVGDGQEACRAAIHGVTKSRTWLNDWSERIMHQGTMTSLLNSHLLRISFSYHPYFTEQKLWVLEKLPVEGHTALHWQIFKIHMSVNSLHSNHDNTHCGLQRPHGNT